ncbi:hypothetical protein PSACC_03125 [Paramicrosporidium saccamoebae]|uniref:Uncharacterized protein n=1 Tax=Paramicrosporidium saccamoebae TaxID=1246581 RepID=A0A2H9TH18_9FUNG|nr:hypothetical protein PSACC_03125 [Paramicrosporidium saccamoebae]
MSCLEHKKCPTGFCKAGKCVNPGADDPCFGEYDPSGHDTCPAGFKCHISDERCRVEGYKPPFSCSSDRDCGVSYFCNRSGSCEFRTIVSCSSRKCMDGYDCVDNKCVQRCFSQDDCFFDHEVCQPGPLSGFNVCVSNKTSKPIKPTKPISPVKPVKPSKPTKPVSPSGPTSSTGGYSTTALALFGVGFFILVAVLALVIRKCCRKKSDPQVVQAQQYYPHPSSPSMPVYQSPTYQSSYPTQHMTHDATLPSYSEVQSQAYQSPSYSEKR